MADNGPPFNEFSAFRFGCTSNDRKPQHSAREPFNNIAEGTPNHEP